MGETHRGSGRGAGNAALGIAHREYVTNEDKSRVLDPDKLALVGDAHVAMAPRMEAEFGLRREEAIEFTPSRDDRGDCIRLKGSTTKGGRPREVPVLKDSQRKLLDEARRLAGGAAAEVLDGGLGREVAEFASFRGDAPGDLEGVDVFNMSFGVEAPGKPSRRLRPARQGAPLRRAANGHRVGPPLAIR